MATAQVVACFVEANCACLAVRVTEAGGNVEYIGRVELTPEFDALSNAEKKEALRAAVKAARDAQQTSKPAAPSFSGTVTV